MRTTLTLEPDVAARLEHLKEGQRSFKELVNTALRRGLDVLEGKDETAKQRYEVRPWNLGAPAVDISNTAEALAYAEGEDFK